MALVLAENTNGPDVVLVIPCYNEASRLNVNYFQEIHSRMSNAHFVFVNDGSTDETNHVLGQFKSLIKQHSILNLKQNIGKANALREGICHAFKFFPNSSIMVALDADASFNVDDVYEICCEGIDVCRSSRNFMIFANKAHLERLSLKNPRAIFSSVIRFALTFGFPTKNKIETQVGLKVFKISEDLISGFAEPFRTRWFYEWELLLRLDPDTFDIFGFEITSLERVPGSKITLLSTVRIFRELLIVKWLQTKKLLRVF